MVACCVKDCCCHVCRYCHCLNLIIYIATGWEDSMGPRGDSDPAGHEYSCGRGVRPSLLAYGCDVPWQGQHAHAAPGLYKRYLHSSTHSFTSLILRNLRRLRLFSVPKLQFSVRPCRSSWQQGPPGSYSNVDAGLGNERK